MAKHLLYIADPMCSWCWGFSPVITEIDQKFGTEAPVRVMVGGLRPYTDTPMRDKDKAFVRDHWQHVAEASGQPFDFRFFDQDGFVYDTEPACRAIVAGRQVDASRVLALLARIHRAFYTEVADVTDADVLAGLAADAGYDEQAFRDAFTAEATKEETAGDFWFAQQAGVAGFPTLLAVDDGQAQMVTQGFQPWAVLAPVLEAWIASSNTPG